MPKKGKRGLPRVDRSRALPVRTGIGLWKVLGIATVFGAVVYSCEGPTTPHDPVVPTTQAEVK